MMADGEMRGRDNISPVNALEVLVGYLLRDLAMNDSAKRVLEGVGAHGYFMARYAGQSKTEAAAADREARLLAQTLLGNIGLDGDER